jgi:hypothetical protein
MQRLSKFIVHNANDLNECAQPLWAEGYQDFEL